MGTYQWQLFVLCGFSWWSDNAWLQCIAVILPRVQEHWGVSDRWIGLLSTSLFAGMMVRPFSRSFLCLLCASLTVRSWLSGQVGAWGWGSCALTSLYRSACSLADQSWNPQTRTRTAACPPLTSRFASRPCSGPPLPLRPPLAGCALPSSA